MHYPPRNNALASVPHGMGCRGVECSNHFAPTNINQLAAFGTFAADEYEAFVAQYME
jgi:hypothetical protein